MCAFGGFWLNTLDNTFRLCRAQHVKWCNAPIENDLCFYMNLLQSFHVPETGLDNQMAVVP